MWQVISFVGLHTGTLHFSPPPQTHPSLLCPSGHLTPAFRRHRAQTISSAVLFNPPAPSLGAGSAPTCSTLFLGVPSLYPLFLSPSLIFMYLHTSSTSSSYRDWQSRCSIYVGMNEWRSNSGDIYKLPKKVLMLFKTSCLQKARIIIS